jgi:transposase
MPYTGNMRENHRTSDGPIGERGSMAMKSIHHDGGASGPAKSRAKAPPSLSDAQREAILKRLSAGDDLAALRDRVKRDFDEKWKIRELSR